MFEVDVDPQGCGACVGVSMLALVLADQLLQVRG